MSLTLEEIVARASEGKAAPIAGTDRSDHPNVVEYAVRSMFKGQTIVRAAKSTAKKLSGSENMFFGSGVTVITPKRLEEALWSRLVGAVTAFLPKIKPGMEHFALDGVLQQFNQPATMRVELKRRVVAELGNDPFRE